MDLRPTKKRVFYSIITSTLLSIIFFSIYTLKYREMSLEYFSPQEFHLIYVAPIMIFIATYLFLGWYMTHDVKERLV